jgi:hypothetical protein
LQFASEDTILFLDQQRKAEMKWGQRLPSCCSALTSLGVSLSSCTGGIFDAILYQIHEHPTEVLRITGDEQLRQFPCRESDMALLKSNKNVSEEECDALTL